MDDARISQLKVAAPLSGSEYIPITQLQESTNLLRTTYTTPDALKNFAYDESSFCPIGMIVAYAGGVDTVDAPSGWLLCDGRSVLRSKYSALFARIGTTYGSINTISFNLPNLKGRVAMGYCDTASSTSLAGVSGGNWNAGLVSLGSVGGEFYHNITAAELPLVQEPFSIGQQIIPVSQTLSTPVYKDGITSPAKTILLYNGGPHYGGATVSMSSQVTGGLRALFGGTLPSLITFSYSFGQSCGTVTNGGVPQSLGCSGNNASLGGSVTVAPDANGDVIFSISDEGWGGQGLSVALEIPEVNIPEQVSLIQRTPFNNPPTTCELVTIAKGTDRIACPVLTTKPYMLMNYVIKY